MIPPNGYSAEQIRAAAALFGERPADVPADLLPFLAETAEPAGDHPQAWFDEAIGLLSLPAAAAMPEVVRRAVRLLGRVAREGDDNLSAWCDPIISDSLRCLFQLTGEQQDIDAAVEAGDRGASCTGDANVRRAGLTSLGLARQARYESYQRQTDIDGAVKALREAASLAGPTADPAEEILIRSGLSNALTARHALLGDRADLLAAAEAAGRASALLAPEVPADLQITVRGNNGAVLVELFLQDGKPEGLLESVRLLREADRWCPETDPRRSRILMTLSHALRVLYDKSGVRDDLDEAVRTARVSIRLAPSQDPMRAGGHLNLSGACFRRYQLGGDSADLEEAIRSGRDGLRIAHPNHQFRLQLLANLAVMLVNRFERYGDPAELGAAIEIGREAAASAGPGNPVRRLALSNTANALLRRSELTGDRADLDEAVLLARESMAGIPPTYAFREVLANVLAVVLVERHARNGDPADIDAGIDLHRHVAKDSDTGRPHHAVTLNGLSVALMKRFERQGDPADLTEAIELARTALAGTGRDATLYPTLALNLSTQLLMEYRRGGADADHRNALAVVEDALTVTSSDNPVQVMLSYRRGTLLALQPDRAADALEALRAAASVMTAAPGLRARAARDWVDLAVRCGDWPAAQQALDLSFAILPLLVQEGLGLPDRQRNLGIMIGLGSAAAAVALQRGDVEGAWTGLEQGRAILHGQVLQSSGELAQEHPALAAEMVMVRRILNLPPPGPAAADEVVRANRDARHEAAGRWQDLLARVRVQPGFARFGLPPTVSELQAAAGDSIVVAINVTYRCDALILSRDGVSSLRLPDLTGDAAVDAGRTFLRSGDPGAEPATIRPSDILRWLWDVAAGPVLDHLGLGRDSGQRIQWMTTGPLSVLPIHAAGHHDRTPSRSDRPRTVLDRVISSYAPSLRSLSSGAGTRGLGPLLVVGIDDAELRNAVAEARAVADALPPPVRLLVGEEAGRAEVVRLLPGAAVVHFACHADGADDPGESSLRLADGPLGVREVGALELSGAWLAVLSTCSSAFGGTALLDESIHIASAFRLAGYEHVVGTLWPVADRVAPRFVAAFYPRLADGASPAEATHAATVKLRAQYPGFPQLWAAYMHFGT
ncbi:MAG: CHAT domain-containing protein [Actinoplanes sp.]